MRISDWSSDVCSSDLRASARTVLHAKARRRPLYPAPNRSPAKAGVQGRNHHARRRMIRAETRRRGGVSFVVPSPAPAANHFPATSGFIVSLTRDGSRSTPSLRSEEQTSELQSLMRISYAIFCLKKNNNYKKR